MDNDLIIDIGADLSSFNSAMKTAEKAFASLRRATEAKPVKLTIDGMVKQLKVEEAAYKKFSAQVRAINKSITKAQIKEMHIRVLANDKALAKQTADTAQKAKEVIAIEKKQTKLVNTEVKKRNPWGNIESIKHAAKTTALYGAMAQAIFGVQNAFKAMGLEIIKTNDRLYQNMAVLGKTRTEAIYLTKVVADIGKLYGGDLNAIQEAMITLGRAGVDQTEQLASATKTLRELALITGDDMRDGAEVMSSFVNVFGQAGINIQEVGNQLAFVANETRLGVKDFSTIANYALSAAKAIGLTKESYLALNGVFRQVCCTFS